MTLDYIVTRFGIFLLVVVIAVSVIFMIPRLMPGDPVEYALNNIVAQGGGSIGDVQAMAASYRAKFGLDQPIWKQYFNYWGDILHGDLGTSLNYFPQRVSQIIRFALPWTIGLLGVTTVISFSLGITMGALLAWPQVPKALRGVIPVFLITAAVPYFLLGIVLVSLLAITYRIFPAAGGFQFGTILGFNFESLWMLIRHATLPALSIILTSAGFWAIGMRGMLVSNLGEDYILQAEGRGLPPRRIFFWYAMRNSLLPQLTALAILLGNTVSGAVLVEVIFSYPGVGFKLFEAIGAKDYFVVQGIVLFLAIAIAFAMFLLDLIYPMIDPRIVYQRK